jgi:indolepyruvate ferredoxin oxidoreductase beta subunit
MSALRRQWIISGVGGQGVLFVTRLLAETALERGLPVLTSETHGMAQRGGTVLSHLKLGPFHSPLIRPGTADGLLALKAENLAPHRPYLGPAGRVVVNRSGGAPPGESPEPLAIDADLLAREGGHPRAANLVLLGYALASLGAEGFGFALEDVLAVLSSRLHLEGQRLAAAAAALEAGSRRRSAVQGAQ